MHGTSEGAPGETDASAGSTRSTAAIAHDLNNVLSIVQGLVELLADAEGVEPEVVERSHRIAAALTRATALVAELTDGPPAS